METPSSFSRGRYRVIREIGRGGMATVYLVEDAQIHRFCAVKLPDPDMLRKEEFRTRFYHEGVIAVLLGHPFAVNILDVGVETVQHGGRMVDLPFLVLEYIEGKDAFECLTEFGPIPPRAAYRIIAQILRVLEVLHRHGIVHRDIKPQNIRLRREDGIAKLIDFGIAQVQENGVKNEQLVAGLTKVRMIVGTPGFMPPEQLEAGKLDATSDLFAVATTLFMMLTGRDPEHTSMWMLDMDHEFLTEVPGALRPIIIGATRENRANRAFSDAREMYTALERAARSLPEDRQEDFFAWLRSDEKMNEAVPIVGATMVPTDAGTHAAPIQSLLAASWFDQASESDKPNETPHRRVSVRMIAAVAVLLLVAVGIAFAILRPEPSSEPTSAIGTVPSAEPTIQSDLAIEPPAAPVAAATEVRTDSKVVEAPPARAAKAGTRRETTRTTPALPTLEPTKADPAPEESEHATFRATGSADRVRLKGRGGSHAPGEVPPGTYTLEASFDGGATFADFGSRTLAAGQTLVVNCDKDFGNCQ